MTLVIGMDEAGYGPNLGPLAIGLSVWRLDGIDQSEPQPSGSEPQQSTNTNLFRLLERVVTNKPDGKRVAIADSKVLYKPGGGLALLERGVLAALAASGGAPVTCFDMLVDDLGADTKGCRHQLPWHRNGFKPCVPVSTVAEVESHDPQDATRAGGSRDSTLATLATEKVRLRALRGRLVFPAEFNEACRRYDSKGLALSHWSLQLLRAAVDDVLIEGALPSGRGSGLRDWEVHVTCDKHGGRNKYAELLSEYFPGYALRVVVESRPRSAYVLCRDDATIEIEFRTKGESQLEAALASMVAKYLRELSMQAFNAFWLSHLPALKPTAGYPMDAKRFKADIEAKQQELGIADDLLWRER